MTAWRSGEQQAATIGYDGLFVQRTCLNDYWQQSDGDKADITQTSSSAC